VPPPDELQLWCQVARINKGKVYGLGSESTKAIRKHLYQESSSSLVHAMREEIEQNNKMLQMLMHKMDVQPLI